MNRSGSRAQDRRRPEPSYSQLEILLLLSTTHSGLGFSRAAWRAKTRRKPGGLGSPSPLGRAEANRRSALEAARWLFAWTHAEVEAEAKPKPNAKFQDAKRSDDFRLSICTSAGAPKPRRPGKACGALLACPKLAKRRLDPTPLPCISRPSPPIPGPANESGALRKDFRGVDFNPFDLRFARRKLRAADRAGRGARNGRSCLSPIVGIRSPCVFGALRAGLRPRFQPNFVRNARRPRRKLGAAATSKRRAPGVCAHAYPCIMRRTGLASTSSPTSLQSDPADSRKRPLRRACPLGPSITLSIPMNWTAKTGALENESEAGTLGCGEPIGKRNGGKRKTIEEPKGNKRGNKAHEPNMPRRRKTQGQGTKGQGNGRRESPVNKKAS